MGAGGQHTQLEAHRLLDRGRDFTIHHHYQNNIDCMSGEGLTKTSLIHLDYMMGKRGETLPKIHIATDRHIT